MKLLEIGTIVLFCASCFRTCNKFDDIPREDIQITYFSKLFDDKTISIVRTRHVHSVDPWEWENPIPSDDVIWEQNEWMSMSNMYAIVVNDSRVDNFYLNRGSAEIYYRRREMTLVESNYVFNARNNTLKQIDVNGFDFQTESKDCGGVVNCVVDLKGIFASHKSCPCIFIGNGMNGVIFWREGFDVCWRRLFMSLLRAGRPYDYYTVKKFRTWQEFWSWDGSL